MSSRNACLDGVASCDIHIVIVGNRGGFTSPSGKLIVEEEYEEALRKKLYILAFVQDVKHDKEADCFISKVSDYVDGLFRQTFTIPFSLRCAVTKSLEPIIQQYSSLETDVGVIEEKLKDPYKIDNQTSLRFILVPERIGEIIDPVSLGSQELKQQLFEIGHASNVGLFSYEKPKRHEIGINEIVILQSDEGTYPDSVDEVRLELTTTGAIIIDLNVTGRVPRALRHELSEAMVIIEHDVVAGLGKSFAFAKIFYEVKDPYKRHNRMFYNVALSGLRYKTLVLELPQGSSFLMGQYYGEEVVIAFDQPRLVMRSDLVNPEEEIKSSLALFRRRINQ
jgi:hypothetical protein